jgi:hypothetical protein
MSNDHEAETDAAYEAFEAYATAKRKADASLTFPDCHDAAQAWVRFVNLYLAPELQMLSGEIPSERPEVGGAD